jgi:hypothetical protein
MKLRIIALIVAITAALVCAPYGYTPTPEYTLHPGNPDWYKFDTSWVHAKGGHGHSTKTYQGKH